MEIKLFDHVSADCRMIRIQVFMLEQGYNNEFDDLDAICMHLVAYDGNVPLGTLRMYYDMIKGCFILGRIAVVQEARKKHIGSMLVNKAHEYILSIGGKQIQLHAQVTAKPFYEKLGYHVCGEVDEDEGVPHVMMCKDL